MTRLRKPTLHMIAAELLMVIFAIIGLVDVVLWVIKGGKK